MAREKTLPRVRGTPLLGNMGAFRKDRLALYLQILRECGDVAKIRFGPFSALVVTDPSSVQVVLVDQAGAFDKGPVLRRAFTPIIGNGLVNNEGESHRRQRRLMAPAFTPKHLANYASAITEGAEALAREWADGTEVRIDREMIRLTMNIVGKTLFDAPTFEETDELAAAMTTASHYLQYSITHFLPVPLGVPTKRSRATRAALDVIDRRLKEMIAERRRSGAEEGKDLLSVLLRARDEDGLPMGDRQIRDEAITLFMAGHETTATTLAWSFYFLASHPDVAVKLAEEADEALGGRAPAYEDLPRLRYAAQVFKEALRIYPPADVVSRYALRDVDVGGFVVKKGETVLIPIYALHRRPECYPDPERYDPERFSAAREKTLPRHAFLPFGAGARACIGNHFALMEGQLVLAAIAQRVAFDLVPGQEVVPHAAFTVAQKDGCRLVVRRRTPNKVS